MAKDYRYNVIIDITTKTSGAKAGNATVINDLKQLNDGFNRLATVINKLDKHIVTLNNTFKTFQGVSSQVDNSINITQRNFIRYANSANQATNSTVGFWRVLRGTFLGSLAANLVWKFVTALEQVPVQMAEIAISSIQAAGRFERLQNALSQTAGSTRLAREELLEIDAVARKTTGLGMEDAEKGLVRLRNLGFTLKQTKDIVAGLATQRLLSGADEQSIDRAVVNLMQLRAGSPQAARDLRELLHALPSLTLAFEKAFGTSDYRDIGQMFSQNPAEAMDKLSKAMVETTQVSGGLQTAWEKLYDAYLTIQRAFGEPFLEPLTQAIKDLTQYLYDNRQEFKQWGQDWADILRGIWGVMKEKPKTENLPPSSASAVAGPGGFALEGFNQLLGGGTAWSLLNLATLGTPAILQAGLQLPGLTWLGDLQERGAIERIKGESAEENKRKKDAEDRARKDKENADRLRMAQEVAMEKMRYQQIEIESKARESLIKGSFQVQEELLNLFHRNTAKDEIAYIIQMRNLKQQQIEEEYVSKKEELQELLKLNKGNLEDERKYKSELMNLEVTHRANVALTAVKAAKELQEVERRMKEERRQSEIEYNNLILQQNEQFYEKRLFYLEQNFENISGAQTGAYETLIAETIKFGAEQARVERENLALKLANEKLTVEERKNLMLESSNKERQISFDTAKKLIEIRKNQVDREIKEIERLNQAKQQSIQYDLSIAKTAQSLFSLDMLSSESINQYNLAAFGGDYSQMKSQFTTKIEGLEMQKTQKADLQSKILYQMQTARNAGRIEEADALSKAYNKVTQSIIDLDKAINKAEISQTTWQMNITGASIEIDNLNKKLLEGKATFEDYDKLILTLAESVNELELQAITKEIEALNKAQSVEWKQSTEDKVRGLELQRGALKTEQSVAIMQARKEMFGELNKTIEKLQTGDVIEMFKIAFGAEQARGKEAVENLKEIYRLQYEIANGPYIDYLKVERALQEDILAIRKRDEQALISINTSKLEIAEQARFSKTQADAKLLEFFASQKGLTDVLGDFRVNMLADAYERLNSVIGKLTEKFGLFGKAISEVLSGLIKLAMNKIFMRLFGVDVNGNPVTSRGGGGSNVWQQFLTGGFGGGGGAGGSGGGGVQSFISALTRNTPSSPLTTSGELTTSLALRPLSSPTGQLLPSEIFSAGPELLGAGTAKTGATTGLFAGLKGGIASMLPFLGMGLGAGVGGTSTGGQILGGIGGALAGFGGMGLLMGAPAMSSMLGVAATTAMALSVAALAAAPLLILGAWLLGRNKKRRQEETIRNKAMVDSLAQLDDLISQVQSDKIDGATALSQAEAIRNNYVEQMNQLTDKKTKGIALKDVSRLDTKIESLKSAVKEQEARQARLALMIPTFPQGGAVFNPMGFQVGKGGPRDDAMMGYFPVADTLARFSNTEYILDAETTRNIGVGELDRMRASKGRSYTDIKKRLWHTGFADGGSATALPSSTSSISRGTGQLVVNLQVGISSEEFVNVVSGYIQGDGGEEILDVLATINENQGRNKFIQTIKNAVK